MVRPFAALLALIFASVSFAPSAPADSFKPALVYGSDGKLDGSFNQAAYYGAERFRQTSGVEYLEVDPGPRGDRARILRDLIAAGATHIAVLGSLHSDAVTEVAAEAPEVGFILVDGEVEAPNVQSIRFKEHEGSFLVGMLAAMASQTGKVGFVGGMDIPVIRRFACGYEQGVKHASPGTAVVAEMTGTTPEAWSDPERGAELARAQFAQGVDVVFAAAGATGLGIYQAAKDAGKLAIGVDINQNSLHPGTMLTSMVKLVDVAIEAAFNSAFKGTWRPGRRVLGLAEGAVGWTLDEANRPLISAEMQRAIEAADHAIVDGTIEVADYSIEEGCAY